MWDKLETQLSASACYGLCVVLLAMQAILVHSVLGHGMPRPSRLAGGFALTMAMLWHTGGGSRSAA